MTTSDGQGLSVGQIARIAGVTVRTLHHYDDIGLLRASERSPGGYRLYTEADVERLQRILFYRELELPLDRIADLVDDPSTLPEVHLRRQRVELVRKVERLTAVIDAIDKSMEAVKMDIKLTPEERLEIFGDFLPEDYEQEAEERWGDSKEWAQSARRTSSYTKDQWRQIKAESDGIEARLAAALADGVAPTDPVAMDLAEAHRQHITTWFYECGYDIHRGLGRMYVDDPRFAESYEKRAAGLAGYVRDAILANAERAGA